MRNRGNSQKAHQRTARAVELWDKGERKRALREMARAARSGHPDVICNYARMQAEAGNRIEAAMLYSRVLSIKPDHIAALRGYYNLSFASNPALAVKLIARLHELLPKDREIAALYGNHLVRNDAFHLARDIFAPLDAQDLLGANDMVSYQSLLIRAGRYEGAEDRLSRALLKDPGNPLIRYNLSLEKLRARKWSEGWALYESRWETDAFATWQRHFNVPVWTGERNLSGRTILLHAEQGIGDTIQFLRFLPQVLQTGARVVIECQSALAPLVETVRGLHAVVERSPAWPVEYAGPSIDLHCPMMSLPYCLRLQSDNAFANCQALLEQLPRPAPLSPRMPGQPLRVGIAWAGNPENPKDEMRSLSLESLSPLLEIPGIEFHSLQVGEARHHISSSGFGQMIDAGGQFRDFLDTARYVRGLDIIVSADTAVLHLAGTLDLPCCALLPLRQSDWRWGMPGTLNSLWYPSMLLFWEAEESGWRQAVGQVAAYLSHVAGKYGN